jgi:hypothetical protein
MLAWAIPESRMVAEPITGQSGEVGWTISWKGRGWWQPFDDYLQLVRDARRIARSTETLIVPSCKFHLPTPDEATWNVAEYEFTVRRLLEAWSLDGCANPQAAEEMPLEKDFSPTLAGSDRAGAKAKILEWLREVPRLVHLAAGPGRVRLGLKIFNALFDDDFQLEMLRAIQNGSGIRKNSEDGSGIRKNSDGHASELLRVQRPDRADFFVYGNRLFDPQREFDGHAGIAYGGPDLSDRNLRVLSRFRDEFSHHGGDSLPFSATGNITSGKMAVEYALRGATSFQLHTFFQLPADHYAMTAGSKTQKALHELYFHPRTGFVVWLRHVAVERGLPQSPVRFLDVAAPLVNRH